MFVILCKDHPKADDRIEPTGDCLACAFNHGIVKWLAERPNGPPNVKLTDADRSDIYDIVQFAQERKPSAGEGKNEKAQAGGRRGGSSG